MSSIYDFTVKDRKGNDDEIHEFCTLKFGTEFPQFAKIDVNGETADPLFAFLAAEKPFKGFCKGVKNAMLNTARFEPTESMDDVKQAVEKLL